VGVGLHLGKKLLNVIGGKGHPMVMTHSQVGRFVSLICSFENDLRRQLATSDAGEYLVVPGIESDSLAHIFRAIDRLGGNGTVFALTNDDGSMCINMIEIEHSATVHENDASVPTSEQTTLGDLLKVMTVGASLTLRCGKAEQPSERITLSELASSDPRIPAFA